MIDVWLGKPSYKTGEELKIFLDFSSNEDLMLTSSNINVNISRITKKRHQLALGFGHIYDGVKNTVTVKTIIPYSFEEGLYLVSARLIPKDEHNRPPFSITPSDFKKLFFWVSDDQSQELSVAELTEKINQLIAERDNYNNAAITTVAAKYSPSPAQYKVLVFGVGCLIYASQNMEGYVLKPLGTGFSYMHMFDAVNTYTVANYGMRLNVDENIRTSFSSSTPLFVIDFANVNAVNKSDAENHCWQESENIFTILAYDRGQRPNSFATVIIDLKTRDVWQGFHFPGYKGNLVSDFSPTATAETLDRLLPKLSLFPWIDLIMRIYADAISEANPSYACIKYWSILEMISKREIGDDSIELTYPDGRKIHDYGGSVVKTKKSLGKAYMYAINVKIPPAHVSLGVSKKIIFETYADATIDPNYDGETRIITLWDTLSALYQVRNSTAHSGKFDPLEAGRGSPREKLAAELWEIEHQIFLSQIGDMMRAIVSHELNDVQHAK